MNQDLLSRRQALTTLAAAVGLVSLPALPEGWQTPVIETGLIPAHAQTSGPVFYRVALVRQLTPCENLGKHHIFIEVKDSASNGVNGAVVKVQWADRPDGFVVMTTATSTHFNGGTRAGLADFAMFKGNYIVTVFDTNTVEDISEIAGPVTPDYGTYEACGNDQAANLPFHISFEIVFQQI